MKLAILCNFGPPHVGGTEVVLENIATRLISQFKYNITIFGHNYKKKEVYKGIKLCPCQKGQQLIDQISKFDHVFTYSDSFWGWDTIVENIDIIQPGVSVALVGAYHMRNHSPITAERFERNVDKFNIICHDRGDDYQWAIQKGWNTHIISNGVDYAEFDNNIIDFREKYGIKEKHVLLNVSNFFYGKGQELLAKIYKSLRHDWCDFRIVSISNTISYPYDRSFLGRAINAFDNLDRVTFLRDIPREDVVAAFKCSNVFVFTSLKEVAPLVILESIAAKLPWVSFDVGNVAKYKGGLLVQKRSSFNKGYIIPDHVDVSAFSEKIGRLLQDASGEMAISMLRLLKEQVSRGRDALDWSVIVPEYNRIFSL